MFLRRLRLSNLRSIELLDMSFETADGLTRPWTFLLGENGAGKSTVLRAIALASAGGEALPEIIGDPESWIREGRSEASIHIDIATARGELRSAELVFRRSTGLRHFLSENSDSLEQIDGAVANSSRNYFVVAYGVSRRRSAEASLGGASAPYRNNRAQNIATLFSGDATLVSIEQWAMDLDYRTGSKGLTAVSNALDALLPDMRFEGIDKKNRQLRFHTPDGSLPLSVLSDGYQAMAAWCGDVLFRITETFADYEDPLKARGLLLIDELDLHLHPLWQRQLVSFLKRTLPNFQIVATTHSPLTIHQAGEGELFVLRRISSASGSALTQFEGAPNKLLLHQLIQSPMFGLDTLDSVPVENLRRELRRLKGFPERDRGAADPETRFSAAPIPSLPTSKAESTQRIKEIEGELEGIPATAGVPEYLRTTNALLEKIAGELSSDNNPPGGATRTGRRGTGSVS